jgi:hypothetical protein
VAGLQRVAKRSGWKLSAVKKGFLVQKNDRIKTVHRHLAKLDDAKISIVTADAVAAEQKRYGMIL